MFPSGFTVVSRRRDLARFSKRQEAIRLPLALLFCVPTYGERNPDTDVVRSLQNKGIAGA